MKRLHVLCPACLSVLFSLNSHMLLHSLGHQHLPSPVASSSIPPGPMLPPLQPKVSAAGPQNSMLGSILCVRACMGGGEESVARQPVMSLLLRLFWVLWLSHMPWWKGQCPQVPISTLKDTAKSISSWARPRIGSYFRGKGVVTPDTPWSSLSPNKNGNGHWVHRSTFSLSSPLLPAESFSHESPPALSHCHHQFCSPVPQLGGLRSPQRAPSLLSPSPATEKFKALRQLIWELPEIDPLHNNYTEKTSPLPHI